jgi:hypothetical protein
MRRHWRFVSSGIAEDPQIAGDAPASDLDSDQRKASSAA